MTGVCARTHASEKGSNCRGKPRRQIKGENMETFQDKSDDVKADVEAVAATETSAEAGGTFHDKSAEEVLFRRRKRG